jgi:hypothetical protein
MGTLAALLLPMCWLLMVGAPPAPALMAAHAQPGAIIAGSAAAPSPTPAAQAHDFGATLHALPPSPRDLSLRRNVRNQAPSRVRRAKRSSRAAGPPLCRAFSSATKPPERAALCILKIRRGRSPPTA